MEGYAVSAPMPAERLAMIRSMDHLVGFEKELLAEVIRLRAAVPTVGWCEGMARQQEKLEAEVDRLRAELETQ